MGTFTRLDDGSVNEIAARFGAGRVKSWRPIAAGTINSNFEIVCERGRLFLRINEGKSEADVRYEGELVEALASAGVPTPPPLPAADGRRYVAYRDRFASLFPWVEGAHRDRTEVTASDASEVGAALARLHVAALPEADRFARAGIYTFADICARHDRFRRLADPELAEAVEIVGDEIDWLRAREQERARAPRGVIHGDLFRDNVLFRDGELVALLDFEQASTGALVYDLAVCVNAWCYDDDFDPALVAALVAGYERVRPLAEVERALLHVELRAAAMRFAVTRITDVYLPGVENPEKDFRRYLARLASWRALGEDGLRDWLARHLRHPPRSGHHGA